MFYFKQLKRRNGYSYQWDWILAKSKWKFIWTYFWGGHTFKTFWSEPVLYLPSVAPKLQLGSKSFRSMTPPPKKMRFLRPNKVLGQKSFFGPPKIKKKIFSQKTQILWFVWTWGLVKGVTPATLMVLDLSV